MTAAQFVGDLNKQPPILILANIKVGQLGHINGMSSSVMQSMVVVNT